MKTFLTSLSLALLAAAAGAQTAHFDLALPEHPGHLTIDQGHFEIDELAVKSNGDEYRVRASDGTLQLSAALFVWPEQSALTAATCRDAMLKSDGPKALAAVNRSSMKSTSGADIALAVSSAPSAVRAFVASGNLCGDILFSQPDSAQPLPMDRVKTILNSVRFDPQTKTTFHDAFAYATIAFDNHDLQGAVHAYRDALALVATSDDPKKWQRISTDQLSISYGMAGALDESRAVNVAAIKRDPDYPMYYYNLACAEAEQSNATDARANLQLAFDHRANVLPGESLPDPATDDSFQTLMQDPDFAAFVKFLPSTSKPSTPKP